MATRQMTVGEAIRSAFVQRRVFDTASLVERHGVGPRRWAELAQGAEPTATEVTPIALHLGTDRSVVERLIAGPAAQRPPAEVRWTPAAYREDEEQYAQQVAATRARLQDTPGYHSRAVATARARLMGRRG